MELIVKLAQFTNVIITFGSDAGTKRMSIHLPNPNLFISFVYDSKDAEDFETLYLTPAVMGLVRELEKDYPDKAKELRAIFQ